MSSLYHIDGICLITYSSGKRDEIFVNVVVGAESEVSAIMAVASDLMGNPDTQSFIWQRLHVKQVKGELNPAAEGETPPLQLVVTP